MTEHWGGAQWVLATLFVVMTLFPLLAKGGGLNKKPLGEFAGWYIAAVSTRVGLIAVLWWGGFWQ